MCAEVNLTGFTCVIKYETMKRCMYGLGNGKSSTAFKLRRYASSIRHKKLPDEFISVRASIKLKLQFANYKIVPYTEYILMRRSSLFRNFF